MRSPLQGVVSFETLTFLRTTALQRCKLFYRAIAQSA